MYVDTVNNKQRTKILTIDNCSLHSDIWSKVLNFGKNTIYERLRNGWDDITCVCKFPTNKGGAYYPFQASVLGNTYKFNKVAYYLEMG